jgi:hypothetical protein
MSMLYPHRRINPRVSKRRGFQKSMEKLKPASTEEVKPKVKPISLTLAWTGGGFGCRPTLLGIVPEGTNSKDVEFIIYDTDCSSDVIVGTLSEFISAYINCGDDH